MISLLLLAFYALSTARAQELEECSDWANPCPTGSVCHPRDKKCYPAAPALDRPSFFLGCGHVASDCDFFGFEYDGSYVLGHVPDTWCDTPTNVRCVSRKAPALSPPTPANQLRVIAYNIWERNLWITMDGQRERTCRFPHQLAKNWANVDVITFQEVFTGGCWPDQASIRDLLTQHGFPYSTRNVQSKLRVVDGGIFVASRWPITDEDQHVYKTFETGSWDMFAAKGVSYARINKTVGGVSRTYHVMGTHFQAGGPTSVKLGQSQEWADFMTRKSIPAGDGVVFGGDFNIDLYQSKDTLDTVLTTLGAELPTKVGYLNYTSDSVENDVKAITNPNDRRKWLDYALYSSRHLKPVTATVEILKPLAEKPFKACWCEVCPWPRPYHYPKTETCKREIQTIQTMSDHFPVLGTFIFP